MTAISPKAASEFGALPWVNNDPMAQTTLEDLLSAAEFEVDLYESGESEAGLYDIRIIKRFIRKWKPVTGRKAEVR